MKYRIKIIYSVITIGILLTGFLLPGQILRMQDQRQAERVDRYELGSITLNVTSQLFEKLSAVKAGIMMETDFQVNAQMNKDEVYQQMIAANKIFGVGAMDVETVQEPVIEARLVIDEAKGSSFIIWQGHMEDENYGIDMIIDDATGKMLGITTVLYRYSVFEFEALRGYKFEELQESLKTYYELEDVILDDKNYVDGSNNALSYASDLDLEGVDGVRVESGTTSHANGSDQVSVYRLINETGEYYDMELYIGVDVYSINWI